MPPPSPRSSAHLWGHVGGTWCRVPMRTMGSCTHETKWVGERIPPLTLFSDTVAGLLKWLKCRSTPPPPIIHFRSPLQELLETHYKKLGDFRQPEANENKEKTAKSSLFLAVMGYFRWQWAAENILPKIRSIFNAFRIKYCHSRWVFMAAKYIIIFCGLHWLSR
jgi:hypothetical protein